MINPHSHLHTHHDQTQQRSTAAHSSSRRTWVTHMSVRVSASGRRFFFGGCEVSWPSESLFGETSRSSLDCGKTQGCTCIQSQRTCRQQARCAHTSSDAFQAKALVARSNAGHQKRPSSAMHCCCGTWPSVHATAQAKPGDIGGSTGEPRPSPSGLAGRGSIRRCPDPPSE